MLATIPKTHWQEGLISLRRLYKGMILLLGYLLLFALWHLSENGRYALQSADGTVYVIDTRTGEVSHPEIPAFRQTVLER